MVIQLAGDDDYDGYGYDCGDSRMEKKKQRLEVLVVHGDDVVDALWMWMWLSWLMRQRKKGRKRKKRKQ